MSGASLPGTHWCTAHPAKMPLRRFCHPQVVAAEARSKELQEELTATYKEKSRLAEELVQASRQLQIVRDSNEAQVTHAFHPNIACK